MDYTSYELQIRVARETGDGPGLSDWISFNTYKGLEETEAAANFLYTVYRFVRIVTSTSTTEYREL